MLQYGFQNVDNDWDENGKGKELDYEKWNLLLKKKKKVKKKKKKCYRMELNLTYW